MRRGFFNKMANAATKYPGFRGNLKWYPEDMIIAPPTAGDYIFVDGNVGASGSGTTWEDAFKTVEEGTTDGGRGDIVMVAPVATNGYYDENVRIGDGTSATEYAKCGMHLMGVTNTIKNVRIKSVDASAELHPYTNVQSVSPTGAALFVNCSGIEVSHLSFDAESAHTGVYWGDGNRPFAYTGQTDTQNGSIHHCTFQFGISGLYYDGSSNDQHCYANHFYKQADQSILISPGGLQQTSRCRIHDNLMIGPENYGIFVYSHAQNKNHIIGPNNVILQQASGTVMTNPIISANGVCSNAVIGNYCATDNNMSLGTYVFAAGNYDGTIAGSATYVFES